MTDADDEIRRVALLFQRLGADEERAPVMASQLLKRARQLAEERGITEAEAARELLQKVIEARRGD